MILSQRTTFLWMCDRYAVRIFFCQFCLVVAVVVVIFAIVHSLSCVFADRLRILLFILFCLLNLFICSFYCALGRMMTRVQFLSWATNRSELCIFVTYSASWSRHTCRALTSLASRARSFALNFIVLLPVFFLFCKFWYVSFSTPCPRPFEWIVVFCFSCAVVILFMLCLFICIAPSLPTTSITWKCQQNNARRVCWNWLTKPESDEKMINNVRLVMQIKRWGASEKIQKRFMQRFKKQNGKRIITIRQQA